MIHLFVCFRMRRHLRLLVLPNYSRRIILIEWIINKGHDYKLQARLNVERGRIEVRQSAPILGYVIDSKANNVVGTPRPNYAICNIQ